MFLIKRKDDSYLNIDDALILRESGNDLVIVFGNKEAYVVYNFSISSLLDLKKIGQNLYERNWESALDVGSRGTHLFDE